MNNNNHLINLKFFYYSRQLFVSWLMRGVVVQLVHFLYNVLKRKSAFSNFFNFLWLFFLLYFFYSWDLGFVDTFIYVSENLLIKFSVLKRILFLLIEILYLRRTLLCNSYLRCAILFLMNIFVWSYFIFLKIVQYRKPFYSLNNFIVVFVFIKLLVHLCQAKPIRFWSQTLFW